MRKTIFIFLVCAAASALPVSSGADTAGGFDRHFRYHSAEGPVMLYSDISDEFTKNHARHARLVWDYYHRIFSRPPGNRIILYYTKDQKLYDKILIRYPTITMEGARQVTANWTGKYREWFIIPYTNPDYGTQLHEISHDFLYFTCPESENFPWFKEGSAMYYESGSFRADGNLIVERPLPSYHQLFRDWAEKRQLIPLGTLLRMERNDFYRADYTKTYSQSMIFFFYLAERHPETLKKVFSGINERKIRSGSVLMEYIIRNTGKNVTGMEREYIDYGNTTR